MKCFRNKDLNCSQRIIAEITIFFVLIRHLLHLNSFQKNTDLKPGAMQGNDNLT